MSTINDGGTAFPMQEPQAIHAYAAAKVDQAASVKDRDAVYLAARAQAVGGMSLRDYFAAKAMQAQLITDGQPGDAAEALVEAAFNARQDPVYRLALNSYAVADAMLKAREQKGGEA